MTLTNLSALSSLTHHASANIARSVNKFLRRANVTVARYDYRHHPLARRMKLFDSHSINVVFDVGANNGGYARGLRELGYRGRIVSFEPLTDAFASLARGAAADPLWEAVQCALGDTEGTATIHVAANSECSSLLQNLPRLTDVLPSSKYVGTQEVIVTTLESAIGKHLRRAERLFVKVDAQGFEPKILAGAGECLSDILGFQLEMSLTPLYQDELLLPEMVKQLESMGFSLMSLEPGYADPRSGRLLQIDGFFFREPPGTVSSALA